MRLNLYFFLVLLFMINRSSLPSCMVHDPFSFVKFKSEVYMLAKRFELEPKSYVAFAVGSMCACTVMLPEPFVRKDKSELEAFVVIKLFLIDTVSITTDPVPFASKLRSPFVLVELTVFPSNFRLSTPKSPSTVNSYSGDDVFTPTLPVLSGNSTRLLLEVVDIVSPFMDI